MKLLPQRRPARQDDQGAAGRAKLAGPVDQAEPVETEAEAQSGGAGWTHGHGLATKGATVGIWAALLCGPVALGLAVAGGGGQDPAPAVAVGQDPDLAAREDAAGDVAAQWVRAWLTADRSSPETVDLFWSGDVALPQEPMVPAGDILGVQVLSTTAPAPGVWSVTVGVDTPQGRRHFQVPVAVAGDATGAGAQAMALPAPVAGPGGATTPSTSYPTQVPSSAPAYAAVQAFLTGYLTGEGELGRYTVPGASIAAVQPPYDAVVVRSISARRDVEGLRDTPPGGQRAQLLVDVDLVTVRTQDPTDGNTGAKTTDQPTSTEVGLPAQYYLTLEGRAGRWEVASIDPSPVTTTERKEP